jgi:hypothetical protein
VRGSPTSLPLTPQKRRHRRHLLAPTGVTNDDVFERAKRFDATLDVINTCE